MPTHHTSSGRLVGQGSTIDLAPQQLGLLDRARKLHRGLATLSTQAADHVDAGVFLAAWCLELSLKAYLAKHGQLKRELRPIQHDLAALWKRAVSFGLAIPQDPPRWCLMLSTLHDDPYHLRYPSEAAASVAPGLHEVAVAIGDMLRLIEKELA